MKIINKIKAFFFHQDEPVELDLIAAEIKEGKAYLHPRGEDNVTYLVRSDDIEITLCKGRSISPKDIFKVGPKQRKLEKEDPKEAQKEPKKPTEKEPKVIQRGTNAKEALPTSSDEFDRFKKKKFTVSLYPDEYEAVMAIMKEYGYKRADFVMACVNSATKGTMEKAHKKIVKNHKDIIREQKAIEARQQQETA